MEHSEAEQLLGAYALDAVDPDEARGVEDHLQACPRCRAELSGHREVTGLFAYAGQEAPEGLWDRIAANMQEPPPALRLQKVDHPGAVEPPALGSGTPAGVSGSRRRATSLRERVLAAVAAAAAVVVAVLGVEVAHLDGQVGRLDKQVATIASGPNMTEVKAALSVPGAKVVRLAAPGRPKVTVLDAVVTPGGDGYVYSSHLSPLPANRTYQLWGVVGHQQISYGLLGTDPSVVPFRVGAGLKALAVTAEVAGGVVHTKGPLLAVGKVGTGTV